jgi:hypothetical protein
VERPRGRIGCGDPGLPVRHPLANLADLARYPLPDPNEAGILDGLLDGIDANAVLLVGEICFPLQDRAHLLMGLDCTANGLL